jgi:hypothetical protein
MVVPNLESMRLYRGRGGEVMRGAWLGLALA